MCSSCTYISFLLFPILGHDIRVDLTLTSPTLCSWQWLNGIKPNPYTPITWHGSHINMWPSLVFMQTCDLLDSRFVCVLHLSSVGANVDVPLPGGVSSATTSGDGSIRVTWRKMPEGRLGNRAGTLGTLWTYLFV